MTPLKTLSRALLTLLCLFLLADAFPLPVLQERGLFGKKPPATRVSIPPTKPTKTATPIVVTRPTSTSLPSTRASALTTSAPAVSSASSLTTQRVSSTPAVSAASIMSSAPPSSPSASANSTAPSCPLPPRALLPKRNVRDYLLKSFKRLFGRAIADPLAGSPEFIGFHGTNQQTANLWTSKGSIVKPSGGTSGADAELGPGLYITDNLETAHTFASGNGKKNNLPPFVCAIFAKQSQDWRSISKAILPDALFRKQDGSGSRLPLADRERFRSNFLKSLQRLPNSAFNPDQAVLFGDISSGNNQLVLPENLNSRFFAKCVAVTAGQDFGPDVTSAVATLGLPDGVAQVPVNPSANYLGSDRINQWHIMQSTSALTRLAMGGSC